jgi:hypothetical protein
MQVTLGPLEFLREISGVFEPNDNRSYRKSHLSATSELMDLLAVKIVNARDMFSSLTLTR